MQNNLFTHDLEILGYDSYLFELVCAHLTQRNADFTLLLNLTVSLTKLQQILRKMI